MGQAPPQATEWRRNFQRAPEPLCQDTASAATEAGYLPLSDYLVTVDRYGWQPARPMTRIEAMKRWFVELCGAKSVDDNRRDAV